MFYNIYNSDKMTKEKEAIGWKMIVVPKPIHARLKFISALSGEPMSNLVSEAIPYLESKYGVTKIQEILGEKYIEENIYCRSEVE